MPGYRYSVPRAEGDIPPQVPVTPPVPEVNPKQDDGGTIAVSVVTEEPLSTSFATLIRRRAVAAFAKRYAKFLIKSGKCDSKEACSEIVGKFIDAVMNRGEASSWEMEDVIDYINSDAFKVETRMYIQSKLVSKVEENVTDYLRYLSDDQCNGFSAAESEMVKKYIQLSGELEEARWKVRSHFEGKVEEAIQSILVDYSAVLLPEFIELYKK